MFNFLRNQLDVIVFLLFHSHNPPKKFNHRMASSREKTRSTQSQTCMKYRGIIILIKKNSDVNTGDLKILHKKCLNKVDFQDVFFNSSKMSCVLPTTLCMTAELWPRRFIWHQDIRVTHCQSSAMSFIFTQYSFCNSFRHCFLSKLTFGKNSIFLTIRGDPLDLGGSKYVSLDLCYPTKETRLCLKFLGKMPFKYSLCNTLFLIWSIWPLPTVTWHVISCLGCYMTGYSLSWLLHDRLFLVLTVTWQFNPSLGCYMTGFSLSWLLHDRLFVVLAVTWQAARGLAL